MEYRCYRVDGGWVAMHVAQRQDLVSWLPQLRLATRYVHGRIYRALPLAHASEKLGMLYVVEDSTLGGQIIRRHVARALRIDETNVAAFFVGNEVSASARWKAFGARVEAATPFDARACIHSGIATFETLERWLVEAS